MIDLGESILAVVTLTPILKAEMPRVGVGLQREILDLPKHITSLAKQLVANTLDEKLRMPRPWSYRQLYEMLTQPIPEATLAQVTKAFPEGADDGVAPLLFEVQSVFQHLANEFPVSDYQTYLGPKKIQPTSDKIWKWYSRYWVIGDPLQAFQLMQTGALLPSQAGALREYHPSLYEEFKGAILSALVERSMRDGKFINLPPRADRGVATFLGKKIVKQGSNVNAQKPDEAKPSAPGAPTPPVNESLQTAGQRAAS